MLEPYTVDAQGDVLVPETIRRTAHAYLAKHGQIGYMHRDFSRRFRILESFITPSDFEIDNQWVTKGSWLMAVRVLDEETWTEVKSGKITGFSIGGFGRRKPL